MPSSSTVRIVQLDPLAVAGISDELAIIDKSDTSASADGTDKKITARDLLEKTSIRPDTDLTISRTLTAWIGQFRDAIAGVIDKTQNANTSRFGVVRFATATEAKAQSAYDRGISAGVLSSLGATDDMQGLIKLATSVQMQEGTSDDTAATPYTIFQDILGDAVIGNSSWVFKLPTVNVVGDIKLELVVQFGQKEFSTMATGSDPTSNFNHIHQEVEFDVTYPEPFPTLALMVIPIGIEATPSQYEEGSDFWIRQKETRNNSATLKATRINGTSDGSEVGVVRYMAIGF